MGASAAMPRRSSAAMSGWSATRRRVSRRVPRRLRRRIRIDGYETVDLRAGVDFGQFSVQAYVRNLFDTYGVVNAGGFPFSVQPALGGTDIPLMTASTIRPRTFGVTFGARF